MPTDLHALTRHAHELGDRRRYVSRVLDSSVAMLPSVRSWDCPPWLRTRILELADEAERLTVAEDTCQRQLVARRHTPMP